MYSETIRRRDLPHWDVPGATYFVTTCLAGSIPAHGLAQLTHFRAELRRRPCPEGVSQKEWQVRQWKLGFVQTENWLDDQPGNRALAAPELARIVSDALIHFAGERYDLLAYVVMPSHLHWLFTPSVRWFAQHPDAGRTPRERIMYSLKRYTANQCNRVRHTHGTFWQAESYDHWVRDVDELERILRYIENNPVKAGLVRSAEQWHFSSAAARVQSGTIPGLPLPRPATDVVGQDSDPDGEVSGSES